jgi:ubiquinone/menaquinone biosynthesis C-methylase UbiE
MGAIGTADLQNQAETARAKAAATYNAAADHFDDAPLAFWDRYGRRTVDRLDLALGARVLDVGCGSGASALPAAERVGPAGHVIGIDLAEGLLRMARQKARTRKLRNIEFRIGDMTALDFEGGSFDAVVCVFAIFFVPNMERQVAELWRMVRPGGQLAITTWGPRFLEPGSTLWWKSIARERPDLDRSFNPWDRISDPSSLRRLLEESGVTGAQIVAEDGWQELQRPEDWWAMILGTGYRWTIEQMDDATAGRIRDANIRSICDSSIAAVETNVVYAVATKPAS